MNGSHTASDGELWVEVFYTTEPSIGSDRSFMLTAVGITAVMTQSGSHYTVLVPAAEAARARVELHRYNIESAPAPAQTRGYPLHRGALTGSAIALMFLFTIAGLSTHGWLSHDWYEVGALIGSKVQAGEWWRVITALTLHADLAHLAGNAGFGLVFGSACAALYGPGRGWLLILMASTLANMAESWWMPPGMSSLGASTAVFAALGLVTAKGRTPHHGHRWFREFYAALIAGVLLLALLGTGDAHTDILGHALGFATGLMLGLPLRDAPFVSQWKDRLGGAVAILTCTGAWALALTHSESFR